MRQLPSFERRDTHKPPHSITLRLNDIHDLFALPRHNPFSEDYLPLSGIDQIALQLRSSRLENGVHVTFILPANAEQTADLQAEIQAALKRYCDTRLDYILTDMKARQINVVRNLQVGVVILGISLALAAAVSRAEGMVDWLRTLLSNSIGIFGSVALWSPADAFLFGMRPYYKDIRIYMAIRSMTFDIQFSQPELTINEGKTA